MNIQYIAPLSRGIARMRKELFNPLDFSKWFAVGFTAFLAGFIDFSFPGGPSFSKRSHQDLESVLYFPQKAWQWISDHPGIVILVAILTFLLLIIGVIVTWLGCRGKFMFLDNVVHSRSRVVAPWHEFQKEGNSFFLFSLVWGFLALAIFIAYIAYCFVSLQAVYESSGNFRALIGPAILAGLGFLVLSLINAFFYLILKDFVIPIMYRDRISTIQAVQKFTPLFFSYFFYFVAYALFLFCLSLLILIAVVLAGCVTCCIGFLILMIPYINSVVLLPISYALRAFSLEFLEQFGPEYQIFPRPDVTIPNGRIIIG